MSSNQGGIFVGTSRLSLESATHRVEVLSMDSMAGAEKSPVEGSEDASFSGVNRGAPLRFATAAGDIVFSSEDFINDVVDSVNELIVSGFNNFEEFAAETLNLRSEEAQCALRNSVDNIYYKVKGNMDEHLSRWESVCRTDFFNMTGDPGILSISDNKTVASRDSRHAAGIEELQEQEEMLDKELCFLRSQLITAERDASRMRRQLTSVERKLALRSEFIGGFNNLPDFDGAILEDVLRSANDLKQTMEKVGRLQRQESVPRICFRRGDADKNLTSRSEEIASLLPQVNAVIAEPELSQLLLRSGNM